LIGLIDGQYYVIKHVYSILNYVFYTITKINILYKIQ